MNPDQPISAIGEIIRSVAMSIAEAQWELDKSSMVVAELMTGQQMMRDPETGQPLTEGGRPLADFPDEKVGVRDSRVFFGHHFEDGYRVPTLVSMMELGFTPNFYQFVDTVIEVKLALKLTRGAQGRTVLSADTIHAAYSTSYSFNADLTSTIRTKIAPIPPPVLLDERIRALLAQPKEEPPEVVEGVAVAEDDVPDFVPSDWVRLVDLDLQKLFGIGPNAARQLSDLGINNPKEFLDRYPDGKGALRPRMKKAWCAAYFLQLPGMRPDLANSLVKELNWKTRTDLVNADWSDVRTRNEALGDKATDVTQKLFEYWKRKAETFLLNPGLEP